MIAALLVGYLPGAVLYRLPVAQRERRARLAAEERVFWHVVLSAAWSLGVVLLLAALERYRFERLLVINLALCVLLLVISRGRILYRGTASRPSWTIVLPIVLVLLGLWRFFPASEYIIGGKDPGTYINEGIQIAQRGTLTIHDQVIAGVPEYARDLFFPSHFRADYYGLRFMGFFVQDPASGRVIGQFPHLFPASIAIGYGLDGLSGARMTIGAWGILGLLAVYFAGARLFGPAASFAGAALLGLHVMQVWFARYPNAELVMQALLFAGLLAFAYAHQDDDRFFGPVAGILLGLLIFLRVDGLLGLVAIAGAAVLIWIVDRRRLRAGFILPLAACLLMGAWYLFGPMRAYLSLPGVYLENLPIAKTMAAIGLLVVACAAAITLRLMPPTRARAVVSATFAAVLLLAAAYAWWFRHPGGKLTIYDAYALRDFTQFYLWWPMLLLALAGLVLASRRRFWTDPALLLTLAAFALFFFYKIRIYPAHFWAARRFLPVILPGTLLLASFAAIGWPARGARAWVWVRAAAGVLFLSLVGARYLGAAAPVMHYVEYEGIIRHLEQLSSRFGDRDLVLFESRAASDVHVLAVPLQYIYARNVLVLNTPRPDKIRLKLFLDDARAKYDRVFFVGGGGTDLLSNHISALPVAGEKIQAPEYEPAVVLGDKGVPLAAAYPREIRHKEFDYGVYELKLDAGRAAGPFSLDVGYQDDLNVVRFNAKEVTEGRTIRWTGPQSFVAIPGLTGNEREVILIMSNGGRPPNAPRARVEVSLNNVPLGSVEVASGFAAYRFDIPPAAAAQSAGGDDPAQLKLVTTLWNPQQVLGVPDNRNLGVMVDRVDVR